MKSDNVKKGMQQAPHRSLFNALGFTEEEMNKPMVGIVSSYNEIVPGHMNLDKIVNAVKLGVAEAGGVPVVFPAIAVCDGIAMGHIGMKYSLVTRDLIADSTECMALAHQFDALRIDCRDRAVSAKSHSQRLGETVHGVRRVHSRTGAAGRTNLLLVFPNFLLRHRAGCIGTYRLKHGREATLFALYMSGKHRSA